MADLMMECGSETKCREKANLNGQMDVFMRGIITMTKEKDMVCIHGKTFL